MDSEMWTIQLLSAAPQHLPALAAPIEEYIRVPDHWDANSGPPSQLPGFFRDELDGLPGPAAPPTGNIAIGVDDAGVVLAAGTVVPYDTNQAEIKRLYVRPDHQHSGIGRALVETLLDVARNLGYDAVILNVIATRSAAIGLYENLGFTPTEPRLGLRHALLPTRPLTAPETAAPGIRFRGSSRGSATAYPPGLALAAGQPERRSPAF